MKGTAYLIHKAPSHQSELQQVGAEGWIVDQNDQYQQHRYGKGKGAGKNIIQGNLGVIDGAFDDKIRYTQRRGQETDLGIHHGDNTFFLE